MLFYGKQNLFEYTNKPGRWLAKLLTPKTEKVRVPGQKNSTGDYIIAEEKVFITLLNVMKGYIKPVILWKL